MKAFVIKDLKNFVETANTIESPFKFYEIEDGKIIAYVHLRTFMVLCKALESQEGVTMLREAGFYEASLEETKKFEFI